MVSGEREKDTDEKCGRTLNFLIHHHHTGLIRSNTTHHKPPREGEARGEGASRGGGVAHTGTGTKTKKSTDEPRAPGRKWAEMTEIQKKQNQDSGADWTDCLLLESFNSARTGDYPAAPPRGVGTRVVIYLWWISICRMRRS